jgi:hypothetical protein
MTNKLLSIFFIFLLTSCSFGPLPDCEGTPLNLKPGEKIHQASSPSWNECKAKMTNSKGDIYTTKFKNGIPYEGVWEYKSEGGGLYEGQLALNKKGSEILGTVWHGQGTITSPEGHKWIGEYEYHQLVKGTFISNNGDQYVGEFTDSKYHGQGTYTFADGSKYVGEWKDNKQHGQGTYTYANGDKYVGEFKDDNPYGQGTSTFANGNKYVGEFKDGKKHGQGTVTYADGSKYVGEYKDNKYHGQGTYTYPSGAKYVGEWKDDKQHGQGTYTYADGSKLVGDFKNDKIRQGVSTNRDGSKYVGEFNKDGMIHGMGTYTFADGTVKKGIFAYDQITGKTKLVNEIPNDLMLSCKYSRSNGRVKDNYNRQDRYLRIHDYKKNKNSGYGTLTFYHVSGYNNSRIDFQTEQEVTFFDDIISFQTSMLIANTTYTLNRSTLNLVTKFSGIFDGYDDYATEHHYRCRVFTDSEFADFIKKIHSDKLQEKQQREDLINRNKI